MRTSIDRRIRWLIAAVVAMLFSTTDAIAASGAGSEEIFLALGWIVVVLLAARIGSAIERLGQPPVLGEILAGIVLSGVAMAGVHWLEPMRTSVVMKFLAEVGTIVLLFQIGLESNVEQFRKVGMRAFIVGTVGVFFPFIGGILVGQYLFPEQSINAHIFLGATLTATSVGISVRVFRDLGVGARPEVSIILGAAVIDDVLGVVILAVVQGLVTTGVFDWWNVAIIIGKSLIFLIGAIVVGGRIAPLLARWMAYLSNSTTMKFAVPTAFCFLLSYIAYIDDLAPIIGAFGAGLILDQVYFNIYRAPEIVEKIEHEVLPYVGEPSRTRLVEILDQYRLHHIEELIQPLAYFFVPMFFVMTGFSVDLRTFTSLHVLWAGMLITAVAVAGKLVTGFVAGRVHRSIVGWGMVPRGEVGLIFASVGLGLGVVTAEEYSAIMVMVMTTTLMTPLVLSWLLRRKTPAM
ncbi:MAG: cation:proton antiporter [Bacteroidota bacterium]|nr:cation:proton antiporter [Bacteroidota bacterium]MDW8271324.1 cation:proton antiporter [Bacteroidota bacterium]